MTARSLPALLGGDPIRPQGPPAWPMAEPEVLSALQHAYADASWGKYHGGYVERLQQRLAIKVNGHFFDVEFFRHLFAEPLNGSSFSIVVGLYANFGERLAYLNLDAIPCGGSQRHDT